MTAGVCLTIATQVAAEDAQGWSVYGQLNLGLMSVDNGGSRENYFAENLSAPSRLGVLGAFDVNGQDTLRIQFETGFGLTNLSQVAPGRDDLSIQVDRTNLRVFEVSYQSQRFGKVSLGQGSMASDGASGVDLTGTSLALGPAIADLGGATEFLQPDGTPSGVFVGDVFDDLDGPRRFRIRYDTPVWNGFRFSAAYGQEVLRSNNNLDYRDVGVTYAHETSAYIFEAAASYEWIDSVEERALVSASALHRATGLSASVATGANRIGEGRYVYTKLGLQRDLFRFGKTAFALEYYHGDDFGFSNSRSKAVGVGLTQNIERLNLDLVASLRRYDLSSDTSQFQDIDVAMLGARWRF